MKLFRLLVIALFVIVLNSKYTHVAQAQQSQSVLRTSSNVNALALDTSKVTDAWKMIDEAKSTYGKASIMNVVSPVSGTIQVGFSGQNMFGLFTSEGAVHSGTWMSSRLTRENGGSLLLEDFSIQSDGQVNIVLWNGYVPYVWIYGADTKFEMIQIDSNTGDIRYISHKLSIGSLVGPLMATEVSADLSYVKVDGNFPDRPFASIDGSPMAVFPIYSETTGAMVAVRVFMQNYGRREYKLALCSGGDCSTRPVFQPLLNTIPQG